MRHTALLDIYSVAGPLFGDGALLLTGAGSLPLVVSAALLFVRGDSLVLCTADWCCLVMKAKTEIIQLQQLF